MSVSISRSLVSEQMISLLIQALVAHGSKKDSQEERWIIDVLEESSKYLGERYDHELQRSKKYQHLWPDGADIPIPKEIVKILKCSPLSKLMRGGVMSMPDNYRPQQWRIRRDTMSDFL